MFAVTPEDVKDLDVLMLGAIWNAGHTPWDKLRKLDFGKVYELIEECMYEDPVLYTKFYGVMPYAIMSKDIQKYRTKEFERGFQDSAWDAEWTRSQYFRKKLPELPPMWRAWMGHGYTDCTLPSDGGNVIVDRGVSLSNGDTLLVKTWEWYNK